MRLLHSLSLDDIFATCDAMLHSSLPASSPSPSAAAAALRCYQLLDRLGVADAVALANAGTIIFSTTITPPHFFTLLSGIASTILSFWATAATFFSRAHAISLGGGDVDLSDACAAWAKGCYGGRAAECSIRLAAAARGDKVHGDGGDDGEDAAYHRRRIAFHRRSSLVANTLAGCKRSSSSSSSNNNNMAHVTFTHMACAHAAAAQATDCVSLTQQQQQRHRLSHCSDDALIEWAQLAPICACQESGISSGGSSSSSNSSNSLQDSCWLQLRLV
jgi:hypothetical protein